MGLLLKYIFIFFLGSTIGYVLELFYRRWEHGKWINPGFLVGPYLPIYGFGLVIMNIISVEFNKLNLPIYVTIIVIGLGMTLLELIGGLIFLKQGIRLWDYRKELFNFKGVICPFFTMIWTIIGGIYCFFIESRLLTAIDWFNIHKSFSFVLGMFMGILIIDFGYSTELFNKIKSYAQNNNMDIMYEKLKIHINDIKKNNKERYTFVLPFSQTSNLKEYISQYFEKYKNSDGKKGDKK